MRQRLLSILAGGLMVLAGGCKDETPPAWPAGAALRADEVTAHTARVSWPRAQDDEGVVGYRLTGPGAAPLPLPPTATSHTFDGLDDATRHPLSLVALDRAGNTSPPLTLTLSTPDGTPPAFVTESGAPAAPADLAHLLRHEFSTKEDGDQLRFSWPEARDNVAVTRYVLRRGETELGSFGPDVLSHALQGEVQDGNYTLTAYDAAGLASQALTAPILARRNKIAMELSKQAGLLKILGSADGWSSKHTIADVLSSGSLDDDAAFAIGNLHGAGIGSGGLAARGSGGGYASIGGLGSRGVEREKVPGSVRIIAVEGEGGDIAQIGRAVRARLGALKACYEKRLKQDPTIHGKIVFSLALSEGKVTTAQVTDATIDDTGTRACSLRVFRRLRFPRSTNQVTVSLAYKTR